MRETTLSHIDSLFMYKTKKGVIGSDGILEILNAKAFFPRINFEDIFSLREFCRNNNYNIENITRLSTVEQQGFKVAKTVSDASLVVAERSIYKKQNEEELLFDISKTTLPYRLSRAYQLRNFNNDFEKSHWSLADGMNRKSSLD